MPNDQKPIKSSITRKQAPRKQDLDNKPIKKAGDGTMGFMLWSIAGTVIAACSSPIFSDVADLAGGGGSSGDTQGGPEKVIATDGRARGADVYIDENNNGQFDSSTDTPLGTTNDAGYVDLDSLPDSLPEDAVVFVDVNGAVDTATGETLSGIWRSLPYSGSGDLIVSPLTNLLALRLEDTPTAVGGEDAFYQGILDSIFGESIVTVSDILDPDNYNVEGNTATQLVSRAAIGLTEIGAPANAAASAGTLTEVQALFADYSRNIADDDATNDAVVLSGTHAVRVNEIADGAESRPVVVDPHEGNTIDMTEGTDFVLRDANSDAVSLFGFEDPQRNDDADGDGVRDPGQLVGIYIQALSADGNIAVRFGDAASSVALASTSNADRGFVPGDVPEPLDSTFFYVSAEYFGQLVLRPVGNNGDFITDPDDSTTNPEIRFYVYDGEDATVDVSGSLDRAGELEITVAQQVPVIAAFTGNIADADPASDTNIPAPVSGTFSTASGSGAVDTWTAVPQQGATAYGTISVTGDDWTFTLNAAGVTEINRLDAGDTPAQAVFDVTATNTGGADTSTLTISLTGINDNSDASVPVIDAFTGSIVDDDAASDTNTPAPVSGTFSTASGSGTVETWTAVPRAGATAYGTISVTGDDWTFTLNAAGVTEINRLDAGDTPAQAVFDVTATNTAGSDTATLTISLTGINDASDSQTSTAPVIPAFTGNIADADPASDTNTPTPVSGTFSATSGTVETWAAEPQQGATAYGTISVTGTQWTFTLNAAGVTEINRLDAGDTPAQAVFDVTATNAGGSATTTLTISLTGINDNSDTSVPMIDDFTGSIVDDDAASDTNTPDPVSGTFSIASGSGTVETWTAVPRAGATAYGTISVTGAEWTFTLNNAGRDEINSLDAGETTDAVFDVTATNVGGADASTLTISLTGINDNSDTPAPVIGAFTGSIVDDDPASDTNAPDPVSGTFSTTSGTADTWTAEPQQGATAYGTISVTGSQWTFTLNAAGITEINRLDAGETTDAVFDVTAENVGGDDTSTLTISLTGIEDNSDGPTQTAPVIPAFTGSVTDADPASDTNAPDPVSGTFSTTSSTADTWMAVPRAGATEYGTIVVTGARWTFTLNATGITEINRLDAGETADAVFDVTATNAQGADESTLTISLTGIVDNSDTPAPVIGAFTGSIADADPASDTNAPDPVSGTFATTSGTADTWMAVPRAGATAYGTIVVTGAQWTFTLNAAGVTEINTLDAGDTTDVIFDVTAENVGGDDTSTLTISLTGIEDNSDTPAPVIGAFTGSIADADPASDTNAPDPVSGTFATTSGTADTWTAVPRAGATAYGTISVTGAQWTFTLNAAGVTEINTLDAGDTTDVIFDVTAENVGGDDTSTLTISLTGIEDNSDTPAPVIGAFTGSIADDDAASDTNAPDPVSGTFSTTSGTADTWVAVPRAGTTAYGTISVTGTQWTFTLNAAGITEINRLDAGDTPAQAVFDVTAENVGGDDTSTLTISLTGIEDNSDTPAPVIGAFTGSITDDDPASDTNTPDPVSGTFSTTSGTADTWMAVPRAGATAYGTIVVTGAQWTFTLNAAGVTEINTLDAGDTTDVIFDVTAENVGGDDTSTLTISLTGIDDNSDGPAQTAPVIPAFTGSITDADPASDTNAPDPVSGTFSTTSSTADTWTAVPRAGTTAYGTIVVTGAQWTFTLNAAGITEINRLDAGGTTDAVFDVTATNAQGSAESTLTISLTGIVDNSDTPAPVIAAFTGSIADADPASDTNAPDPVSGTFSTTSGTADTWTAVLRAGATAYGTIVVTGAQWTFTLNTAGVTEINTLDAGDTTDVIFDVTAENVGGDDTSTLTISLTGIEDNSDTPAPVIGAFTGSIADADPASDTNAPDPVSGTFATTSGTADTWTAVPRAGATAYGTISVTGAQWTFTLNAAGVTEINTLDAGDTTDVIFDVTAENVGGDDTSTLTISLTGIEDNSDTPAPVIGAFTGSIADADPASDTNAPAPVSGTFSTTSGTADTWTAVPQASTTAYGTISVTGSQWTFTLNAAGITEINSLDAGDTPAQAVFDVTATNVGGADESTLTISLTGIEDNSDTPAPVIGAFTLTISLTGIEDNSDTPAPVIGAFTGSIADADPASDTNAPAPVSGTFSTTSGTADTWTAVLRAGTTAYGTIVVTGTQWTFTLNAAGITEINSLDAGDTPAQAVFDVTATNVGGSDTSTLTISLTGIDDNSDTTAPVIGAFTGSIADADPASDTNAPDPVSGTFATTSGTADTWTAVLRAGTTAYGTIVVTGTQWTFTLNAAGITEINSLDAGDTPAQAVFDVTATNVGGSAESTLTISLTGIDDNSDGPLVVTNEAVRAFVIVKGVEFRVNTDSRTTPPSSYELIVNDSSGEGISPLGAGGDFAVFALTGNSHRLPANIARIFDEARLTTVGTITNVDIAAIILEEDTTVFGKPESHNFSSVNTILDDAVTEDDAADSTARGFLQVTGAADGDTYTYTGGDTTRATTTGTYQIFEGTYGELIVDDDGNWTYVLDNTNPLTQGLDDPQEGTDRFAVTVRETGGAMRTEEAMIEIRVNGAAEVAAPVIGAFTGSITDDDPASDTNAPNPVSGTFSTTSGTADGWMAVPRAGATEYGTIVVTGTQWTFTLNAAGIAEINRLDAGDTLAQAVFDVTATNVGGSAESTLTISLTGIDDNSDTTAPVIPAFTGSIADADPASDTNAPNPVSGTFSTTSGTADGWMAVPRAGATAYGTIVVTGTQWTFTLNAAGITEINRLDAGGTTDAVFDVTATNVGGSAESTLTISLTGIVDNSDTPAPVIAAFTGSIADADPASDTNAPNPVSGTFSTTSGTADGWTAVPRAGATAYGTISVTGSQWTFTLNAAGVTEINRLDAGDTPAQAVFDVTATNVGGSAESTLTISLTGIVDNSDTPAPVIAAFTGSIADADPASDTNAPNPVSGTFSTTSGTADGWMAVPRAGATEYGTIVVTGTQWTFTLNAAGITEINRLDAGDTPAQAVFDVTATNVGGSDESTLTISLTGIVDNSDTPTPVIAAFTGSIADADPASDTNAPNPVSGTFATTSGTADGWTAVPRAGATAYGTISVTGSQWTFTLNAAGVTEINRLDAGDTPAQAVFDVTATNVGGSAESTLTISLTGIDDNSDTSMPVDTGDASFNVTSTGNLNAAAAGHVLTVRPDAPDPDGNGVFTYRWQRDGVNIASAISNTYTIVEDDEGTDLTVIVSYTDGGGFNEMVETSAVSVPVPDAPPEIRQITAETTNGYYHLPATGQVEVLNHNADADGLNYSVNSLQTPDIIESRKTTTTTDFLKVTIDENGIWKAIPTKEIPTFSSSTGIAERNFYIHAHDTGGTHLGSQLIEAPFNKMNIVRTDGNSGSSENEFFIGTTGDDNFSRTGGGTDVIVALEGDDTIRLGRATSDTIYHRFSSSDTSWVNTDGGDTITNFNRNVNTFIFVDTDSSVVSESQFISSPNIRFFATIQTVISKILITKFEIRFSGEGSITFEYNAGERPDVTGRSDPASLAFLGTTNIIVNGTREITNHNVWSNYFGTNPDAFQVIGIDDDDLPPLIADLL